MTLICIRFLGCFVAKWVATRQQQGNTGRVAVVRLGGRLLQALALIVGVLALLQSVGINLTPVLAGLGVGGIAVALASQKTLENLFGGMMVIGDSPVRIGQFCRVGTMTGTVEDIGLRSTRIRTLDRTVISIPNADMAIQSIENFAERDKFLFNHTLTLRYETTADQLRFVLAGARTLLYQHPRVDGGHRARAAGEVHGDRARRRAVRLRDGDGDRGVPGDPGGPAPAPDGHDRCGRHRAGRPVADDVSHAATPESTARRGPKRSAPVQAWRERGELPFPDESPERKRELQGGIEYPPAGSALAGKGTRR